MGLAVLTHGGKYLQFRTNPNSITWTYNLTKYVDETYGGRVVQLLGVNIDSLAVTAHAGLGGWPYLREVVLFFRDMLLDQRDTEEPGLFSYPNRGWEFAVYAMAMPFADTKTAVAREFNLAFKVQEDVSGLASAQTMDAELAKLHEGIGYEHNDYNYVAADDGSVNNAIPGDQQAAPGTGFAGTTTSGGAQTAPVTGTAPVQRPPALGK